MALLGAVDVVPLLLNENRQVVAFNKESLHRIGVGPDQAVLGMRPGELMRCIQSPLGPAGCGSGNACRVCGSLRAILDSQEGKKASEGECLLTVERKGKPVSMEMQVRAVPVSVSGRTFTFLFLRDISEQKRARMLERLFLHDIRNTISGLFGWAQHMRAKPEAATRDVIENIFRLSDRLSREVQEQKDLIDAEAGTFEPSMQQVPVASLLADMQSWFGQNPAAKGRSIQVDPIGKDVTLWTDRTLLQRVLTNMLKNALEATPEGGRVRLWCEAAEHTCTLFVQNPGTLNEDVALQVFLRSFSTKSEKGRGYGTYSMKLFGEGYLGGQVDFRSNPEEGTIFWIALPIKEA
jgi:signal transduction histidine kinase